MVRVCPECFGDEGLKRRIEKVRPGFERVQCDRHRTHKSVPLSEVARIVDEVFRANYGIADPGYDGDRGDGLDLILSELMEVEDDDLVTALIVELIEADDYWPPDGGEPFYDESFGYERHEHGLSTHSALWNAFRTSIQYDQRFFNAEARSQLAEIFDAVHLQRNVDNQGPVYIIKPGAENAVYFRARLADDEKVRADIAKDLAGALGPPPNRLRKAGRMNASGVVAFYGAFDLDTCVAELRPSVGSLVAGCQFEITEPLCVLDMTRFHAEPKELNLFAPDHIRRAAQSRFLRRFMEEIAQPISQTDEHLDYIPTQAVAEYLAHHHEFTFAGRKRRIEAVIYASAQNPKGKNIAILGEAARVKATIDPASLGGGPGLWPDPPRALRMEPPASRLAARPESTTVRRVTGARFTTRKFVHFAFEDLALDDITI